jgi:hypothetical protein
LADSSEWHITVSGPPPVPNERASFGAWHAAVEIPAKAPTAALVFAGMADVAEAPLHGSLGAPKPVVRPMHLPRSSRPRSDAPALRCSSSSSSSISAFPWMRRGGGRISPVAGISTAASALGRHRRLDATAFSSSSRSRLRLTAPNASAGTCGLCALCATLGSCKLRGCIAQGSCAARTSRPTERRPQTVERSYGTYWLPASLAQQPVPSCPTCCRAALKWYVSRRDTSWRPMRAMRACRCCPTSRAHHLPPSPTIILRTIQKEARDWDGTLRYACVGVAPLGDGCSRFGPHHY